MTANKISLAAIWGGTYKVDSAGWTPGDLEGFFFVDAGKNQRTIIGNTADTLAFNETTAPVVGNFAVFTAPGWTARQYEARQTSGVFVQSYVIDDDGERFPILQNTTDTLVTPSGAAPTLAGAGGYIEQGGVNVYTLPAPASAGVGYWTIVDADGAAFDDSATTTGAVTATAGGTTVPATRDAYSQAMDLEGISLLSIDAGFYDGSSSSPAGALSFEVSNRPGPQAGAQPGWNGPGPSPLDTSWKAVKVSLDGAAPSTSAAIADAAPHVIIPSEHPSSPLLIARWGRLHWVPGMSPGTGNLTAEIFGYGAQ